MTPSKGRLTKSNLTYQKSNKNKATKLTSKKIKTKIPNKWTTLCILCLNFKIVVLTNSCSQLCSTKIICHFQAKTLFSQEIYTSRDNNNYSTITYASNNNKLGHSLYNKISSCWSNLKNNSQTSISNKCTKMLMCPSQSNLNFRYPNRFLWSHWYNSRRFRFKIKPLLDHQQYQLHNNSRLVNRIPSLLVFCSFSSKIHLVARVWAIWIYSNSKICNFKLYRAKIQQSVLSRSTQRWLSSLALRAITNLPFNTTLKWQKLTLKMVQVGLQ